MISVTLKFSLRKKIPVIFFDRVLEHSDCTNIVIDNFKAAYEVTQHLIQQGCRRIVHLTANLKRNVYSDRLNGYRKALSDAGLPNEESLVIINNLSDEIVTSFVGNFFNTGDHCRHEITIEARHDHTNGVGPVTP